MFQFFVYQELKGYISRTQEGLPESQRGGAWLTQLVKHVTLDFEIVSSSPTIDVEIT